MERLSDPAIHFGTSYARERAQVSLPGASMRRFRAKGSGSRGGGGGGNRRSGAESMLAGRRIPVSL